VDDRAGRVYAQSRRTDLVEVGTQPAEERIVPLEASDIIAIQQLYAAYNVAADHGDGKAFGGCFTADGVFDLGTMRAEGSDALAEFANGIPAAAPGSRHIATNVLVEGEGDLATGQAYLMLLNTCSSPPAIMMTGQYEDRLVRSIDGWRFTERRFTPDAAGS
jgi:ketosteroid isomerase-like protein